MREIMSTGELKRYLAGKSPGRIVFNTGNQLWNKVEDPLKANLVYTSIVVMCHPNIICLKGSDGTMCFERVKTVTVDTEKSPLGTVLDIICGDRMGKDNDVHYILILT